MNHTDGDILIMKRSASDNKYLHKDFHQSMNILMDYIFRNFGEDNLVRYLIQYTRAFHQPLHKLLERGEIKYLVSYFTDIYEKEEWPVKMIIREGYLEIEQEGCPGISHIKSLGKTPTPLYIETYRTVYSTLCEGTPIEYSLVYFNHETGACKQVFKRKE